MAFTVGAVLALRCYRDSAERRDHKRVKAVSGRSLFFCPLEVLFFTGHVEKAARCNSFNGRIVEFDVLAAIADDEADR